MKEYYIVIDEIMEEQNIFYCYEEALEQANVIVRQSIEDGEIEKPKYYDEKFEKQFGLGVYKLRLDNKNKIKLPYEKWCKQIFKEIEEENRTDEEIEKKTLKRLYKKYKNDLPQILKGI